MGSCAAPSAKGDDKFITTDYLQQCQQAGRDPFAAIEAVMSWDAFAESVTEAQRLAQPEDFDFLHRIGESYATLRRYAPEFLDVLKLRAAPAAKDVLDAIEVLRSMNSDNARKVPTDAPTEFIKPRWQKLVMTDTGIDRRYYELCALSELKNALSPASSRPANCRWPWPPIATSTCMTG